MIVLFTDYGLTGPYVGELHMAVARRAPGLEIVHLMHDAPAFNPRAAAYLLAALVARLPQGAGVAAVVDPGVGTPRPAHIALVDGRFLVGPANGLLEIALRRGRETRLWRLDWSPEELSATFHGRDLFVPAATRLITGARPGLEMAATELFNGEGRLPDWPDDLAEVIYIDGFGNCVTGLRRDAAGDKAVEVETPEGWRALTRARTFADAARGDALFYENSSGLMEVAVNQGSAREALGLEIGSPLRFS